MLYIFTRLPLCLSSLASSLASLPGQDKILLLWDVEYEHCLAAWQDGGDRIVKVTWRLAGGGGCNLPRAAVIMKPRES